MAWADVTSSTWFEHDDFTDVSIDLLIMAEFWFFWQTHVAMAAASVGHKLYVYMGCQLRSAISSEFKAKATLVLEASDEPCN
jgi:hypothetical protein